jgi:hypothetical protein
VPTVGHERIDALRAERKSLGGDITGRHVRSSWSLPVFAGFVTMAFVALAVVSPKPLPEASAVEAPGPSQSPQEFALAGEHLQGAIGRDSYTVTEPEPVKVASVAPAAGVPDPGSAQAIALEMVTARGWGADEFNCLVALWDRESGWNVYAHNPSSGAYGIPQSLPGDKMASAGADWATNPATQITWGLTYIQGRYGTPCGAWAHSEAEGWY